MLAYNNNKVKKNENFPLVKIEIKEKRQRVKNRKREKRVREKIQILIPRRLSMKVEADTEKLVA
jgi:inner membrane protein involved in colicin E2 resistance